MDRMQTKKFEDSFYYVLNALLERKARIINSEMVSDGYRDMVQSEYTYDFNLVRDCRRGLWTPEEVIERWK